MATIQQLATSLLDSCCIFLSYTFLYDILPMFYCVDFKSWWREENESTTLYFGDIYL